MPIRIRNFGGIPLWLMRKHYSKLTSKFAFPIVARLRARSINKFIECFIQSKETPCFGYLMLETLNRCNGKCSFCPANVRDEKREYKKMSEELFSKIIDELVEIKWTGTVFLQVNNEPFLDKRIVNFAQEIKDKKPECRTCIISNGTLLSVDKIKELVSLIDELVINDYSDKYRLSENLKEIYTYVKGHKQEFESMDISISRRFDGEILATRAGSAPNKPKKNNNVKAPCVYPYVDLTIFPDGKVGICCNDCLEQTEFGDVNHEKLLEIWNNEHFTALRREMRLGREHYPFCRECDVVDAGRREKLISSTKKR